MKWKTERSDNSVTVPSKICTKDGLVSVVNNYSINSSGVTFEGHVGFERTGRIKSLEKFNIPFADIVSFYYSSLNNLYSVRTSDNEFRNIVYCEWFSVYGDNYSGEKYIGWQEYYDSKIAEIWKK